MQCNQREMRCTQRQTRDKGNVQEMSSVCYVGGSCMAPRQKLICWSVLRSKNAGLGLGSKNIKNGWQPRKKKNSRMPLTRKNKDAILMADRAEKMMSASTKSLRKKIFQTPKIAERRRG